MPHEPTRPDKECVGDMHTIEFCETCVALICHTCKDDECDMLEAVRTRGLKLYKPAPNPYGVTY